MTMDITLVPAAAADDADLAARLTDLINRVYADAEKGLWVDGTERTHPAEVREILRAGQLAVARLGDRVVGCVRVRILDDGAGEFGMLVADPDHRGLGLGTALVRFAERWAVRHGARWMQLELLMPRAWRHPVKDFLRNWYTRIGYRETGTGRFDEEFPELQQRLATPCDFVIFRKPLTAPDGPAGP
jgi:GNAT superfamily N-acetyltransferase